MPRIPAPARDVALALSLLLAPLAACARSVTPKEAAATSTPASASATSSASSETVMKLPEPEPTEAETFLAAHAETGVFRVRLVGKGEESLLAHARCAYFEWAYGDADDASYAIGYRSEAPLAVVAFVPAAEGKPAVVQSFELSTRKLRPYVAPSFARALKPGDKPIPEPVAELFAKGAKRASLTEHCLAIDHDYQAIVRIETYRLPPRGPGAKPGRGTNRVLVVSDRPFVDGKPAGEVTPAFRNWSY